MHKRELGFQPGTSTNTELLRPQDEYSASHKFMAAQQRHAEAEPRFHKTSSNHTARMTQSFARGMQIRPVRTAGSGTASAYAILHFWLETPQRNKSIPDFPNIKMKLAHGVAARGPRSQHQHSLCQGKRADSRST
ncbi:unnamed protein product [Hermetia illucens]|uniref:Uncharacterized protein n=1 Tax=Hermetia illucens TaxID=343691 RepID=A0A7R8YPI6_HERIL|nr:unnamed protein product [Hermetia illucens]